MKQVASIIFVFVFFCGVHYSFAALPCPPLSVLPGTALVCYAPSTNETIDCVNSEVPRGTIGKYKCWDDENFSEAVLKCRCKRRWRGISNLNQFMSNCNMSIPNDGPAELNLTTSQINELTNEKTGRNLKEEDVKFRIDGLAYHNFYRKIHRAPPLQLNTTLSEAAQKWADQEVSQSEIKTQPWPERPFSYGQNMYRVNGSGIDMSDAVKLAVASWYQGAYTYNYTLPAGPSAFSQVVWASTTEIGIGVAQAQDLILVVANYAPPGNIIVDGVDSDDQRMAKFKENVHPPNSDSL